MGDGSNRPSHGGDATMATTGGPPQGIGGGGESGGVGVGGVANKRMRMESGGDQDGDHYHHGDHRGPRGGSGGDMGAGDMGEEGQGHRKPVRFQGKQNKIKTFKCMFFLAMY